MLPLVSQAVEIPRTLEEALERQKLAENGWVVSIPINQQDFVSRAISAQIKGILDPNLFIAIAMAESGLEPTAKNWNCWYGKVSRSCDKGDRGNAWSVDCGIMQLNFKGLHCPEWTYDVHQNIEKAIEKYHIEGLNAWSVYKNKTYMKYLSALNPV